MATDRIRIDVDARSADLDPLLQQFEALEERLNSIANAAGRAGRGLRNGVGGGGRGGGSGAGGLFGGPGTNNGLLGQLGGAFGIGSLVAIGVSLRDAVRFNAMQMQRGANLGVDVQRMQGFNASIGNPFGGASRNFALRKEVLAASVESLVGESDMAKGDRDRTYQTTAMMNEAFKVFRTRGIDPNLGMGAAARFLKTFNLGPESVGLIAEGFAAGAEKSGLARTEDFVRFAQNFAAGTAGMKGTALESAGLTSLVQSIAPRSLKGQKANELQGMLLEELSGYIYHGSGSSMSMTALMRGATGGRLQARQMGPPRAIAAILDKYISSQAGMGEGGRALQGAGYYQLPPQFAELLAQAGGDPDTLRKLRQYEADPNGYLNIAGQRKTTGNLWQRMTHSKSFRAEQTVIGVENAAYTTANMALDAFEGKLVTSSAALTVWTAMLSVGVIANSGGLLGAFGRGARGAAAGGGMLGNLPWWTARGGAATSEAGAVQAMRWRAGSVLSADVTATSAPFLGGQTSSMLSAAEARAMQRAATKDAVAAGINMRTLGAAAGNVGSKMAAAGEMMAGFVNVGTMAVAGLAIAAADIEFANRNWNPAGDAINALRDANRKGQTLTPDQIAELAMQSGATGLAGNRRNVTFRNKDGVLEGRTVWDWGDGRGGRDDHRGHEFNGRTAARDRAAVRKLREARHIGLEGGGWRSSDEVLYGAGGKHIQNNNQKTITDNRTITIVVKDKEDAIKVGGGITDLAQKELARSLNEKDNADSGGSYYPDSPRDMPPGGNNARNQMGSGGAGPNQQ